MIDRDIHKARALVVEPQPTLRSILISQLRDLGVGQVSAVGRTRDARLALERDRFDIVVCAREFEDLPDNGQDLLDELRRENQLPHGTVFLMLTSQASYLEVMEAAEAASDGLLIRPCSATALQQRLREARKRKRELGRILRALDGGELETALRLAVERWQAREPYALWCGRLAGELLLRLNRPGDAQTVFARLASPGENAENPALPGPSWATLGMARALMASGELPQALQTVRRVTAAEPGNADAHDIEAHVQVEMQQFDRALDSLRRAVEITPSCLLRNQQAGTLAFFLGHDALAREGLERAVVMGAQSKLFDGLTLALLALLRLDAGDGDGLRQAAQQLARSLERQPTSERLQRLQRVLAVLTALHGQRHDEALAGLGELSGLAGDDGLDLETACVLLAVWARVPAERREAAMPNAHAALVRRLGLRFITGRSAAELLSAAARREDAVVSELQQCQQALALLAEQAMARALEGDAPAALQSLLRSARETLNAKTLDVALAIGRRAAGQDAAAAATLAPLLQEAEALQARCGRGGGLIGGSPSGGRSPGGLLLRVRDKEVNDAVAA